MGDRGQVKINGVYLYTHWGATNLVEDVQRAIAKKWRWGDDEYLARIILDEIVGDEQKTETGYGIGTTEHNDIWRLITLVNNVIVVKDNDKEVFRGSYEEFLKFTPKK